MLERREWKEFQDAGLLWWINRILHTFGWAIVIIQNGDGSVGDSYPARTTFRGFERKDEDEGYQKVSDFLKNEAKQFFNEANNV